MGTFLRLGGTSVEGRAIRGTATHKTVGPPFDCGDVQEKAVIVGGRATNRGVGMRCGWS